MRRICLLIPFLMLAASVSLRATDPLRVAVAGVTHGHTGGVAAALQRGEVEVVGVFEADPRYRSRNALTRLLPADRFYDDLGRMLDQTRPEAVVAYGSIKDHLSVVQACAPRGIHVMVEKPLAASLRDARKMAALARKYGIHVLTNYETTWYPANHALKYLVDQGRIGPVHRIEVYDGHRGPVEIGCSEEFLAWLCDPVLNGGGAVIDFGCYGADLATWLLGGRKPESVYAVLQHNKPQVYPKVDDDATIVLRYPGVTVQIIGSWCWPYDRKDMYVYGRDGYLYQENARRLSGRLDGQGRTAEMDVVSLPEAEAGSFAYLREVVRGTRKVEPDELSALETNLTVVEILDAALRSDRKGRAVKIR